MFTLEIETTGSAFEGYSGNEVARILRALAKKVESGEEVDGGIFDINGNKCGSWCLEAEEEKKMTYREMVVAAWGSEGDEEEFGHRLFILGDWLGNEGSRASQFPDAEPIEEPGDDWEVAFQEDRPDEFEN